MSDVFFLTGFAGFAGITWGLLALCDWLMGTVHERS